MSSPAYSKGNLWGRVWFTTRIERLSVRGSKCSCVSLVCHLFLLPIAHTQFALTTYKVWSFITPMNASKSTFSFCIYLSFIHSSILLISSLLIYFICVTPPDYDSKYVRDPRRQRNGRRGMYLSLSLSFCLRLPPSSLSLKVHLFRFNTKAKERVRKADACNEIYK